jgi:hypothetical protein
MTVTVLAVLAAVAGIVAIIGVLAGAFLIHGLDSLGASDAVRVVPGLLLAGLYLLFARAAWTLRPWGWTLGVVVGVATVAYLGAILAVEWAELMRDAPPLAWMSVLVMVLAAIGLVAWFRTDVRAAFDRS